LRRSPRYGENFATEEKQNMEQRCGHGVDIIYESRLKSNFKTKSAAFILIYNLRFIILFIIEF